MPNPRPAFLQLVLVLGLSTLLAVLFIVLDSVDELRRGAVLSGRSVRPGVGDARPSSPPNSSVSTRSLKETELGTAGTDILSSLKFDETSGRLEWANQTHQHPPSAPNQTKAESLECRLPLLDPWNWHVLPFLNEQRDPMRDCKPSFHPLTRLEAGKVVLTEEERKKGTECRFR